MAAWSEQLDSLSALVALLGLVYVLGGVTLWVTELAPAAETLHRALYQLVVHVLFGGVILALGVHVERSDPLAEERSSVLVWCYGGFTLTFVLTTWGHLGSILDGDLTVDFVSDFVVFTSLGAFGVIAGVNRGRATRNRRLAERNEEQRETLALLTRLVSHDVRNDIGIMQGYAELLEEEVADDNRYALEVIRDRADDSIALLEDASTLVQTRNEEREFEPIDLSRVLEKAAASLSRANPETSVETDVPSGLTVEADHLIRQLFSNLLENAVAHNDPEDLRVSIEAREDGGRWSWSPTTAAASRPSGGRRSSSSARRARAVPGTASACTWSRGWPGSTAAR